MELQKYFANQQLIEPLPAWVQSDEIAMKAAVSPADPRALESEIDVLVYGLFGLTAEEILVVKGR
ncbi:MAG: hypothetical protein IPN95_17110 [Bacteroidetes bacterium]|nr:hypothetical protein [Bacteroidota bacterium]MBL0017617.1 hypothetical protein [Bacteroidota bacterium]